jgi:hypothetical protein
MLRTAISFEWKRDPQGYRLVGDAPSLTRTAPLSAFHLPLGETQPSRDASRQQRIVRRGGQLVPYRPLDEFGFLFKHFVNAASDAQGLLRFVEKFGPLTPTGLKTEQGDPVTPLLEHATVMREYLGKRHADSHGLIERIAVQHGGINFMGMTVKLDLDLEAKAPRFQFYPRSLLDALWLQLGHGLANGVSIRQCGYCHELFEAGSGTRRRADAKFCSDRHKVFFHSGKRGATKRAGQAEASAHPALEPHSH